MKIMITGGSGFIGSAMASDLVQDGHEIIILSRHPLPSAEQSGAVRRVKWDGRTVSGWGELVDGLDAIVNLAGENLSAGRWTPKRKQAIIDSRVNAGAAVVEAIQRAVHKPKVLIQASGVGCYGTETPGWVNEGTPFGLDFLAGVCRVWEASTQPVESLGVRRVVARSSVVLSAQCGALPRMLLPFKFFLGGPLGSGEQWLSWVHLEDEVRALRFLMENPRAHGAFNISAQPVTNRQFTQAVGKVMHRPAFFTVPAVMIRLLFGEMSTVVLDGQRVSSNRLEALGFEFHFPTIEAGLMNLLHT